MSQTTNAADALLKLVLNATGWANIADNTATSPATQIYVSLHTATPGVTGNQTTNEAAYVGYARQAVVRTSSGWTVVNNTASPNATISFPIATGGSEVETFMGIGLASSGAGTLLWYGSISPTITVSSGITPQLGTGTVITGT
jgi:hypothetical protein